MKTTCIIALSALVLAVSLLPMNDAHPNSQVNSRQKRALRRKTCYTESYLSGGTWRFRRVCTSCWFCSKKRSTTATSTGDVAELEQQYQNYNKDDFFAEADSNCDGYLDSAEWFAFGSAKDFMELLEQFDSDGDELLTLPELSDLSTEVEVEMMMLMPMGDFETMLEDAGQNQDGEGDVDDDGDDDDEGGDGDDGPKGRKMPSGGGNP